MKAQTTMSKSIQRFFLPALTHPWLEFSQRKLNPLQSAGFSEKSTVQTIRPSPVGLKPPREAFNTSSQPRGLRHIQSSQSGLFGSNEFPCSALTLSQGWGCSSCTHGWEQQRHESLTSSPSCISQSCCSSLQQQKHSAEFSCSAKRIPRPCTNLHLPSAALNHQSPWEIREQSPRARQN